MRNKFAKVRYVFGKVVSLLIYKFFVKIFNQN